MCDRPSRRASRRPRAVRCGGACLLAALGALAVAGCRDDPEGPVKIVYWEKWTKFEGQAAKDMVEAFNKKYEGKIHVEIRTIAQIEQKLLLAIAGDNPPDVAGIYAFNVAPYADHDALICLDDQCEKAGISRDDYIPVFWDMCQHRGRTWALPTTPATVALHWNKRLFKDAGLDPDTPPKTLEELDEFARKLTKYDEKGEITQAGFLPQEPGWWHWAWGFWFGGTLWDGHDTITTDCPGNIRAFEWIKSYSDKYGVDEITRFSGGFGNFSSPQNAFLSGKVAMELQGVWMHNFIDQYARGMDWDAAPFPSATGAQDVTIADADVIVIPRGSRHPKEAWEFIRFANSPEGMAVLCMGQRKFPPLSSADPAHEKGTDQEKRLWERDWKQFWTTHPHRRIQLFYRLAKSPNCRSLPSLGVFRQYDEEMGNAFDRVRNLNATPAEALADVRLRVQRSHDRETRRLRRRGIIE